MMDKETLNITDNQTVLVVQYCSQSMNEVLQKAAGMVVYGSQLEKILTLAFIVTTSVFTLVGQFSVIITILLSESLRQMPHFVVILTCCVADLVMVATTTPLYVWLLSYGCIPKLPCRVFSATGLVSGFGIGNWIGFMALERVVYFCYPMHYERHFCARNMAIGMGIIFGVSGVYVVTTELLIGREYHATVMGCNLPSSSFQTLLQLLLFILPAAIITVVCVVKIWRLTKTCSVAPVCLNVQPSTSATQSTRSENLTGPAATRPAADDGHALGVLTTDPGGSDRQPATPSLHAADQRVAAAERSNAGPATIPVPGPVTGQPPPGNPSQQAKKTFRMIVLVSGAFWGTILPSHIIRTCLVATGHTWIDLDARTYPTQAIMLRLGNYSYSSVSSLLNPLIYFYSRRLTAGILQAA